MDKGYRGHNYTGGGEVYFPGQYRKRGAPPRKWFRRRSSIEASISHAKQKNRLSRNYLKGVQGDEINAILAACGHNLRLILGSISFWLKNIWAILAILISSLRNFIKQKARIHSRVALFYP